jgi:hypothetical protein
VVLHLRGFTLVAALALYAEIVEKASAALIEADTTSQ